MLLINGNYALDKGTSTLDQRHRLSVNWLWRPMFTTSTSAFAKYLVNGWELSGITTLASAHPVTATMNAPGTGAGAVFPGVTLAYGTLNGSGGWNRVPFLPVGTINIDQTYNVDARITRSLPFGERVKANLSFEAFNAFNTIHNTGVQTAAYSVSAGGILKPVLTSGVSLWVTATHPKASRTAPTPGVCRLRFASSSEFARKQFRRGVRASGHPFWFFGGSFGLLSLAAPHALCRGLTGGHRTGIRRTGSAAEFCRTRASGNPASPGAGKGRYPSRNSAGSAVRRAARETAY